MRGQAEQRTERRREAHIYGLRAESIAALLLRLKGYTILARRFVVSGGEIDLVARRGGSIAFVEVKARADLEVAAIAISATKRRRIARAARVWLARNPWAAGLTLRGEPSSSRAAGFPATSRTRIGSRSIDSRNLPRPSTGRP
jgi:putative endonuclease